MKQELFAGIIIVIIGLMLCLFPAQIWKLTEVWKPARRGAPSGAYMTVIRIVGGVFYCIGVLLMFGIL